PSLAANAGRYGLLPSASNPLTQRAVAPTPASGLQGRGIAVSLNRRCLCLPLGHDEWFEEVPCVRPGRPSATWMSLTRASGLKALPHEGPPKALQQGSAGGEDLEGVDGFAV